MAIVSAFGGITSHPAILARERGIPCVVVGSPEAWWGVLEEEMEVVVDGTKGLVLKAN